MASSDCLKMSNRPPSEALKNSLPMSVSATTGLNGLTDKGTLYYCGSQHLTIKTLSSVILTFSFHSSFLDVALQCNVSNDNRLILV